MSEESKIMEDKILSEYFKVLATGYAPHTRDLKDKVKDRLEVECLDLAYGKSLIGDLTANTVHDVLSFYKHVHYHEGKLFFECQNPLFHEWYPHQKLLTMSQD